MRNETILCVATRAWDSLWRDSQQIMSRIAADNRVLYFEPGRNPDRALGPELWRNLPNFLALRAREVRHNLTVIPTPSCLPMARKSLPHSVLQVTTPWAIKVNAQILIRHIRRAMSTFDVRSPILWLYEPRQLDLVGKFGEKLVCYYNYDDFPEFAHNKRIRHLLRRLDNDLVRKSDVVFTTSRGQWQRSKELNPATHLIPNGVDFDLFHRALDPGTVTAPDIAPLRRPIIGYVGWLGYQIDVDLLLFVAEACPDCTLVLVGPDCLAEDTRRRRLHSLPNVRFLGQKQIQDLPSYLKAVDVALVPYVIGDHTLTVYPLKLHEYLAAGRPIVATALPELQPFREVVRVADTYADLVQQIRVAVEGDSPEAIAARVAVARENTWDRRVAEIHRVLDAHLNGGREKPVEEYIHRLDALQPAK